MSKNRLVEMSGVFGGFDYKKSKAGLYSPPG
jgi:hypothetical protein